MRFRMSVGHVIVCGRIPVAPVGYFIRDVAFASRWMSADTTGLSWNGFVLATKLRGEDGAGLDPGVRVDLEKIAQRNVAFVIWIDGASDDPAGWKVIKDLAHEIAVDTGGALLSLRDRAVLDSPPLSEVDAAWRASLDAHVEIDRAVDAARGGDGAVLEELVDVVLEDARHGRTRAAAIVANALVGPVYGREGEALDGVALRTSAEQLARIARALDSGRASALYPTLVRARERLGEEPSTQLDAALADREQQTIVHETMLWAEENPPSQARVAAICAAACRGDLRAIAQIHAWALRFPADPPSPLSREEMGERLALVAPFCAAVRAADTLVPEIWNLANAVMGSKLVESGGTLAALRAKLPKESGA
jgi:hypothetical protein